MLQFSTIYGEAISIDPSAVVYLNVSPAKTVFNRKVSAIQVQCYGGTISWITLSVEDAAKLQLAVSSYGAKK